MASIILEEKVISTKSQEEFDELMLVLHEEGFSWPGGFPLNKLSDSWRYSGEMTCVAMHQDSDTQKATITYDSRDFYESQGFSVISLEDFYRLQDRRDDY